MTTDPRQDAPILTELSPADFRARLPELLAVYVAAMRYPRGTEYHRAPMWSEHSAREGWQAFAASLPDDPDTAVGIAYGYRGDTRQWWNQQVRAGMRHSGRSPEEIDRILSDYFELTELHVRPDMQGRRIGELLLSALLRERTEAAVLLSTPEVPGEDNRAWRLYRRFGFQDVVRRFVFTGDARPFAVLGRSLPLEPDLVPYHHHTIDDPDGSGTP
ncbi:Ribosomal protein S18 acetylase RimI [Rhodococcus rhodochrous J3]|jgi:ribosomal protein S18 acetylase RimI-like enzyme|uniref:GNAT family N-acetyltransferase n=2 Tax=Rhodococcus rhodochrous TaxID=1829 RepID=A0AA46WT63_RHORH|nr:MULTISPECIES: GNAT family N-acetyltransferase [Rhodococcus]AYA26851.1 N-acetyltransferase [Rhodococcus rhodochrous]MBF4477055.1 GNAT family N-acetyltransferase [Rhodococcus rhodochrous]MCB8908910.1 GNAT family N-acetyltransferase [Rhodococcus rhodochrous]MDC3727828.1 GNAT family N-acetyltransferase [Rhodococcus sp. Rp3]MDO1482530.1 GNAT family N-acetyltransferase [Rhodococcus rhodochrous]